MTTTPATVGSGSSAMETAVRPIANGEFALFQDLIRREAGIHLAPAKKALLVGRLTRRLKELGLTSFGDYYRLVSAPAAAAERVRMLDCVCTNETRFFREPRQFEFLEQRVFPEWSERAAAGRMARHVHAWSAACSTGEEPYSLAMTLLARLPGWKIEVLATDLSTRALEAARAGCYRIEKSREVPEAYLKAFMLRGTGPQQGLMKVGPEVRSAVSFARHNLSEEHWAVSGPFHLVFCRNVLIYFDNACKVGVVDRLLDRLHPDGFLLLGHAEGLYGLTRRARSVGPTIYAPLSGDDERPRD